MPRKANPRVRAGIVAAARDLLLARGYAATGIDEICRAAGVTKGALFHHFATKEALAGEVLRIWCEDGVAAYTDAPFLAAPTAVERLLGYVDFTIVLSQRAPIGCLIGTMALETAETHPALRRQCDGAFRGWEAGIAALLENARRECPTAQDFDAASVAAHFVAVFEGAQLMAKTRRRKAIVAQHLQHFRAYVQGLLGLPALRNASLPRHDGPRRPGARRKPTQ